MRTEKQAAASRENGSKSNGPVTEEGKARSAQNASLEGFAARYGIAPVQSGEEFETILDGLVADLKPAGLMQGILVERIATFIFKIRRLGRAEMMLLEDNIEQEDDSFIDTPERRALWERFVGEHIRNGDYVPKTEQPTPDQAYAKKLLADDRTLERLQSYELKLQKTLHATLRELRRVQKQSREETGGEEDLATNLHESTPMQKEELAATRLSSSKSDERGCTRMNAGQMNAEMPIGEDSCGLVDQDFDQNEPEAVNQPAAVSDLRSSAFICGSNPLEIEKMQNEPGAGSWGEFEVGLKRLRS